MKPAVHQFLPSFAGRDAIGRHTLIAQRLLRRAGFESDIYAGEARPEVARLSTPYQRFGAGRPGQPTWLLYQCSTGSPVGTFVAQRPEPLVLDYHNITPAELFEAWEPTVGVELVAGRKQLGDLAGATEHALAVSAFNAAELQRLGYRDTTVSPILLDLAELDGEPDPAALARLRDAKARRHRGVDWLFVGRLAPNKAQHDVIKAFAAFVRTHNPGARLHLVGGSSSHRYETALREYVDELGMGDRVNFALSVPDAELRAYYANADVFVCLSDHEGVGVPLLEAMRAGVPIVAYAAAAVPETLATAGLLLEDKHPLVVAATVDRVLADGDLRGRLVAAGHRRVSDFGLERTGAIFLEAIERITSAAR